MAEIGRYILIADSAVGAPHHHDVPPLVSGHMLREELSRAQCLQKLSELSVHRWARNGKQFLKSLRTLACISYP